MSSNWKTGAIAQWRIGLKNSCGCAYKMTNASRVAMIGSSRHTSSRLLPEAPPSRASVKGVSQGHQSRASVIRLPTKVPILEPNPHSPATRFPLRHAGLGPRGLCLGPAHGGGGGCAGGGAGLRVVAGGVKEGFQGSRYALPQYLLHAMSRALQNGGWHHLRPGAKDSRRSLLDQAMESGSGQCESARHAA